MSRKRKWKGAALILAAMLLMIPAGCAGIDQENKNLLQLKSDGRITQVIVDDVQNGVTGEELENYINEAITAYQDLGTGESISLETCRVKNGKVNITLLYSSVAAYSVFNQVKCFLGTVKEAYDAGYSFEREFTSVNGADIPYFTLPALCTDCMVLIVEENIQAELPGDLFITSDDVKVDENGTIVVNGDTDVSVPELFQTTTVEPVFLIYKTK